MWWEYIIIAAVLILGVYCFLVFTRFETHQLSRKSDRSAESLYRNYADRGDAKPSRRRPGAP